MKLSVKMLVTAAAMLAAPVAQAQVLGGRGAVGGVVGGVVGSAGGAVSGAVSGAGAISGLGGASGSGQGTGMFGATFGHQGMGSQVSGLTQNVEGIGGGRAWGTFDEAPKIGQRGRSLGERFSEVSDGVVLGRTVKLSDVASKDVARGSGQAQANAATPRASASARTEQNASKQRVSSSKRAEANVEAGRVRGGASGDAELKANR